MIVPAFTWVATANAVVYCGATPVFADVDRRTYNLDAEDVRRKLTPRTRAVIAVHLFGLCADVDALRAVAARRASRSSRTPPAPPAPRTGGRPAGGLGDDRRRSRSTRASRSPPARAAW